MNRRLIAFIAALCCVTAGSAHADTIDVKTLSDPTVAGRMMPGIARSLLQAGIPDVQTRIALLLVAADDQAAERLMDGLDDTNAVRVQDVLADKNPFGSWQRVLQSFSDRTGLSTNEQIALAAAYAPEAPATPKVIERDERRRFLIERVTIRAHDGTRLAAIVVRRRGERGRVPGALEFTIYAGPQDDVRTAEYAAARGYAGVIGYSRGKAWGSGRIAPYRFDGVDADATISWIARQSWSDGKVGMYGGSYDGFTQWAAAKYRNPTLTTIVPYVANNPGNGLPMENNVFLAVNYAWIYYITDNAYVDDAAYESPELRTMNQRWFESGKSYRELPAFFGRPNPWFQKWLDHPSFDSYWQSVVPYRTDFAEIDIPVLTVTGYYDDGQGSALNFLKDHQKYDSRAVDFLVIGPYDHLGSQRAHKDNVLRGYAIDPVAQYSTLQLTFDWFDWTMRDGKRPALLEDRVNFEVMGANRWRHVHSLQNMATSHLRYYLIPHKLASRPPEQRSYLSETIDFGDRKTVNGNDYYPNPILGAKPDLSRGLVFVSEPFERAVEIDGAFTAHLVANINKRDMDVEASLYQVLPNGQIMHLSYFLGRGSYVGDMVHRHLLTPGVNTTLDIDRTRVVSRNLEKGSRLMLILDGVKSPFAEINYGTGGDVSRENIRDARVPLHVRWSTSSYIDIPL